MTLIATTITASAGVLPRYIRAAESVNETYRAMLVDVELGSLRYEKSRIEARDEIELLLAESAFLGVRTDARRALQLFYAEVADAVFGAIIADFDMRIADSNLAIARSEERAAGERFRAGLVPEGDLFDARIAVRSAEIDRDERSWQRDDAMETLSTATGLRFDDLSVPRVPPFSVARSIQDWTAADPAVERARVAERIVALRLDRHPRNAAPFDRLTLETELDRSQLAVERALNASERTLESVRRRSVTLARIVETRAEQLRLSEAASREADERFDRGLLTISARDQSRTRVMTAQRNLVDATRNFLKVILEYAAAVGTDPEELL
ncbi:MAG: TolC family protein [Spirochaetaceae bacterium]|nr:MAG: TolC family protein [Spirochaetaceae bacterium]